MIIDIALADFRRLIRTPSTWLLLAAIYFLLAFTFFMLVEYFTEHIQPHNLTIDKPIGAGDAIIYPFFWWSGIGLLAFMPLLGMRLWSEEKQQGTWILLRSAPVNSWEIVIGKYLFLVILFTLLTSLLTLMPLSLIFGADIDLFRLASASVGLWLLLCSFGAASLYCSTLSDQPVVAALLAYILLCLLALFYFASNMPGKTSSMLHYMAHFSHFPPWLNGQFNSEHLTYYILFTLLFLWLAYLRLNSQKFC